MGPDPREDHPRGTPGCDGLRCKAHAVTDTRTGLATILGVNSGAAAAVLLTYFEDDPLRRLNYNFGAYGPDVLGEGHFGSENATAKRTLEFREAGGSLDAEFISTWARISAGIVRFCRDASVVDFLSVLERILGEEDRRTTAFNWGVVDEDEMYDVCDLLEDMCMFSEAATIRRRERRRGPPR
jgi:hypothetical protein